MPMIDFPKRTGDYQVASNETFNLIIPNSLWVKRALMGALFELTREYNWRMVGSATEEQAAQIFTDIYNSLEL